MKAVSVLLAPIVNAIGRVQRFLFNALTGNSLARIERAAVQAKTVAEENRRLLRGIHDSLQDQTLVAHLLAKHAEKDARDAGEG